MKAASPDDSESQTSAPEAPDERTVAFNRMTREAVSLIPQVYSRDLLEVRAERAAWAAKTSVDDAHWITIPSRDQALRARILAGATPVGTICVHVHGGGWVLGGADQQDTLLDSIRTQTGMTVLSIDYRLAPEHPFPAPLDDVTACLRWVMESGDAKWRERNIVVVGESAGANLVAGALVRLRGHAWFERIVAASFHYGTFDLSGTPSLRAADPQTPFVNARISAWFAQQYVPRGCLHNPEVSPLHANVSGMPRALFLVGSEDPVIDDSRLMHARWTQAGNPAELQVVPGGLHGLLELQTPVTRRGREALAQFLVRASRIRTVAVDSVGIGMS